MEQPSELLSFLQAQKDVGQTQSEGTFTVSREKARLKIARFGFPFAEAWAIKVVQAVVATGGATNIKVTLGRSECRFEIAGGHWNLDDIENAFYNPDTGGDGPLKHLMVGLWSVALHDQRAFQLSTTEQESCLIWNGETMNRASTTSRGSGLSLTVTHGKAGSSALAWMSNSEKYRRKNADLLTALSEYCFPCPVPLTVDGRRMDALQFAMTSGWLEEARPVGLCLGRADLPTFGVPPGTYADIEAYAKAGSQSREWKEVSRAFLDELNQQTTTSLALLLTVCVDYSPNYPGNWSKILWVQHGALIDAEPLIPSVGDGAAACFLSAQGLKTDLSTLALVESPERKRRAKLAKESARLLLRSALDDKNFDRQSPRGQTFKAGAIALIALGLGTIWAAPIVGAGAMACGIAGLTRGGEAKGTTAHIQKSLRNLHNRLCS